MRRNEICHIVEEKYDSFEKMYLQGSKEQKIDLVGSTFSIRLRAQQHIPASCFLAKEESKC